MGAGRIVFGAVAARREPEQAAGDDERSSRSGERSAERLDGELVRHAAGGKVREVVNEGGVDDAVGRRRAAFQAVVIGEIAALDLGARGRERLSAGIRAREAEDLVACGEELVDDGRADETGCTCYKDAHVDAPW